MKNIDKKPIIGFDLDGVLVESISLMNKSWNNVRQIFKIEPKFEEYQKHIGIEFTEILKNIGISKGKWNDIKKIYFEYNNINSKEVYLYDGVDKLFEFLDKNSFRKFLITSKNRKNTMQILKKFNLNFDLILTPDDVKRGKPDPESSYVVKKFFKSDEYIFIGDMESDRLFSMNSGFKFIYSKYGYGELDSNKNIEFSLENIFDLKSYLEK